MADDRRYTLKLRIGAFILVSLVVFFAIVYLLGARARYFLGRDSGGTRPFNR